MKLDQSLVTPIGLSNFLRIKQTAKTRQFEVNATTQKFVLERALARIFGSEYAHLFMLKGGATLMFYEKSDPIASRATSDLDIDINLRASGLGPEVVNDLEAIIKDILGRQLPEGMDDGVRWDIEQLKVARGRSGPVPGGAVETFAQVGQARVKFRIDVGYDSRPTAPHAKMREYSSILPDRYPSFPVRCYPPEYTFADKLQAGVRHGESLSRVRDFYDLFVYSTQVDLDDAIVQEALRETFALYGSTMPTSADGYPQFGESFIASMSSVWPRYVSQNRFHVPIPTDFRQVAGVIMDRLDAILTFSPATTLEDTQDFTNAAAPS